MTYERNRRTVLKGIGTGAIALTFSGTVSAGDRVRYLARATGPEVADRIEDAGFDVQRSLADGRVYLVLGDAGRLEAIRSVSGVQAAERDLRYTLDGPKETEAADTEDEPFHPAQWDKQVTEVSAAHDTATGNGRTVAIIDTGVDHNHPDLGNVVAADGRLFREDLNDAGVSAPGASGEVQLPATQDSVYDQDCIEVGPAGGTVTETRAFADDVLDHGTHVAGIAAGQRNDLGIVGTAPDAEVVPLRVFYWIEAEVDTDGDGDPDTTVANLVATFGGILSAIDHAADLGVDAMNLSIGTAPLPPQYNATAIRGISERVVQSATARGSLVVVSAGNSNANLQQGGFFTWPNSMAGAMSISATGPNDERVFYSNYGTNEIDVGAPGGGYESFEKTLCADWDGDGDGEYPVFDDVDDDCEAEIVGFEDCELPEWPFPTNLVLSSVPPEFWDGDYYAYFAGTSMAAPQVTGTAALVREVAPNASANQVEQAIEQGADLVEGKNDPELGAGRLNAAGAVDSANDG